ncbi:MAG: hypothetical protein G8345_11060 [Magnetococcales bacterium]|nr:patatin-like phospholipase family protein [Magnetococcales bacterium]NGZ27412.1 hypothetical protein [Magnetococcales bacterium]
MECKKPSNGNGNTILDEEYDEICKRRVGPNYSNKVVNTHLIKIDDQYEGYKSSDIFDIKNHLEQFNNDILWPDEGQNIPPNRVGLAISGGGIRSATFSLGVLQYLVKTNIFSMIDYMSTVSGGGFIGSSITSWYTSFREKTQIQPPTDSSNTHAKEGIGFFRKLLGKQNPPALPPASMTLALEPPAIQDKLPKFPFEHDSSQKEPVPMEHLRNYANYLTPTGDLADKLRMPAMLIRGIFINFLLILPFFLWAAAAYLFIKNGWGDFLHSLPLYIQNMYEQACEMVGKRFVFTIMAFAIMLIFNTMLIMMSSNILSISWKKRNNTTRFVGNYLLFIGIVFAMEVQPLALEWYRAIIGSLKHTTALEAGNLVGLLGALSSIFFFFVDLLKDDKTVDKTVDTKKKYSKDVVILLAYIIVPLFFWIGFLYLVNLGISDPMKRNDYIHWYLWSGFGILIIGSFININRSSLHVFYRDRLSRAYLIKPRESNWRTSRPKFNDTLLLSQLECATAPYHLINTTLNVTKFDDDFNKQREYISRGRKADFFLFSKHWVGSELTGYCKTMDMEKADPFLDLATAMAISGAAISPNMGTFTVGPLSALMTLLNVRLGYWLPNPLALSSVATFKREPINTRKDSFGFWNWIFFSLASRSIWHPPRKYLFNEALGNLSVEEDAFINLSDGGHIENLGIFQLLKRQCRLIIALDSEADPKLQFEGLAATIRLARTDLHVFIEIDTSKIVEKEQHWAIGKIWYSKDRMGTLLYIKSSLCQQLCDPNLIYYSSRHPDFPHESTIDQFFNEEQFEAYRSLGYHIAKEVFVGRKSIENI